MITAGLGDGFGASDNSQEHLGRRTSPSPRARPTPPASPGANRRVIAVLPRTAAGYPQSCRNGLSGRVVRCDGQRASSCGPGGSTARFENACREELRDDDPDDHPRRHRRSSDRHAVRLGSGGAVMVFVLLSTVGGIVVTTGGGSASLRFTLVDQGTERSTRTLRERGCWSRPLTSADLEWTCPCTDRFSRRANPTCS